MGGKMKTLVVIGMLLMAVPAFAQDTDAQIEALIKARGEDQKVILELKNQLSLLANRVSVESDKITQKRTRKPLEDACASFGKKLGEITIKRSATGQSVDSFTCR